MFRESFPGQNTPPSGAEGDPAGAQPADGGPGLLHRVGNALVQPGAVDTAIGVTANVADHAANALDIGQQPGKKATVAGVATLVEGAATELEPYAGDAPEGSVREWLYGRFHKLESVVTPENVQRAAACAALIKAGVQYAEKRA